MNQTCESEASATSCADAVRDMTRGMASWYASASADTATVSVASANAIVNGADAAVTSPIVRAGTP